MSSKNILIEFEVSMFGVPVKTIPLPFFILALRIAGKNVTIVSHQVILNFSLFEGHTNIKGIKSIIMTFGIKLFYYFLIKFSNKIVVFEEDLKEKLTKSSKIRVIPHGVQEFSEDFSINDAREKLNLPKDKFIVLMFGYVAWYKGTDWIANEFEKLKNKEEFKDFILLVGGGPNPNHVNKVFYEKYIDYFKKIANDNIIYTGFIDEKDIPLYFCASSAVILPYRAFMSASGPLSIAYSFKKPVFVSSKLSSIFKTADLKLIIEKVGIDQKDITFSLDTLSLEKLLRKMKDDNFLSKVSKISNLIKKERSFQNIGRKYLDTIE
jgi:glycosyltransferase involved in cell wall biosynthesis